MAEPRFSFKPTLVPPTSAKEVLPAALWGHLAVYGGGRKELIYYRE
jgi:hypothetical protein